jgi:hypothetical protein
MTDEDRENERKKLFANWCNTLATAILAAGCFVPVANYLFGALPSASTTLIYGTGFVCIGGGVVLHLIGQAVLGALE